MAPMRAFEEQENEILDAVARVLKSGMWVYANEGKAFEDEFAKYMGCDRTVAVSCGTDSLILSLMALGVGPGDEVITPAYSFFASASVIKHVGATPVFCDIDEKTFNIDPEAVKAAITPKTVGIIPVHLYGLPADMKSLREIADKNGLFLLEDACQAVGARINGKAVGTFGDLAGFSFYPTKNLSACGEGGCISGKNAEALEIASKIRLHGETKRYYHSLLGLNARLEEIQSAILRIKLKKLPEWTARRQEIAGMYTDAWADLPMRVPYVPDGFEHVFHLYVIKSRDRERLREYLNEKKIGNGVYYPVILPGLEIFRELGYNPGEFPVSEHCCREVLALPIFPQMTEGEIEAVIQAVYDFHGSKGL
ncbi:MAG: DegT/DnrJ/EryC1/StrS family aminotransferase [bacterium]|nr:DegT/DnrJ/EryC1/StrS family aminotransferase [bacterium]